MPFASLQILGTATGDSSPSVLVCYEEERYLFDVGEGLQRFCFEHKVKVPKIAHIFLSRLEPDACGGLPGFMLTAAQVGRRALSIVGPHGTGTYMHATRHFVRRPDLVTSVWEVPPGGQPARPYVSAGTKNKGTGLTIVPVAVFPRAALPAVDDTLATTADAAAGGGDAVDLSGGVLGKRPLAEAANLAGGQGQGSGQGSGQGGGAGLGGASSAFDANKHA